MLRKQVKEKLAQIDLHTYKKWSNEIQQTLTQSNDWKRANVIAVTMSRGKEVETRSLIKEAWKEGKKVAVPKCYPSEKQMEFRYIASFNELEVVYFGIEEPVVDQTDHCTKEDIDLIIVPGIVFHPSGYRIGYGGGYYDRFLQDFQKRTISLAFSIQVVTDMQHEQHDVPVQAIITEKGWIHCGNQ